MAIITTGTNFNPTQTVTSTELNDIANAATFDDPVDDSTLELHIDGKLRIKDAGVTFAKLTDVIDDDTMATATATTTATSESIKAYVTAMRPKFVALTGGTTALLQENKSDGTTVTYNISDFTSGDSDFATSKITGLIVEGFVFTKTNTNLILASLPDGTSTVICRGYTNDGTVAISDAGSTLIPINSDTSTFSFEYTVGNTAGGIFNQSRIRGAIIQPGL